jgi:hypothetical protein
MSTEDFFASRPQLESRIAEAQFGSQERIAAYWELLAYELETIRRGIDPTVSIEMNITHSFPHLNDEGKTRLVDLNEKGNDFLDRNELIYRAQVLDGIMHFFGLGQQSEDFGDRFANSMIVQGLVTVGLTIGLDFQTIRGVIEPQGYPPRTEPLDFSELGQGIHEIAPSALPPQIRNCLEVTEFWDEVQNYVQRIILIPEIEMTEMIRNLTGTTPEASAFYVDGTLIVRTHTRDASPNQLRPLSPWEIAELIVHEMTHIRYMEEIQDDPNRDILMRLGPNEREAYARELLFLRRYSERLRQAGNGSELQNQAEQLAIAIKSWERELYILSLNLFLNENLTDTEPLGHNLPSPELVQRRFSLADIEALDLNIYPTRLGSLLEGINFPALPDRVQLASLRQHMQRRMVELTNMVPQELREQILAQQQATTQPSEKPRSAAA